MVEIPVGAWHAAYNDVCTISINETCMTAAEVPQVGRSVATERSWFRSDGTDCLQVLLGVCWYWTLYIYGDERIRAMNDMKDICKLNMGCKDVITAACKRVLPYCEDPWDARSLQPMFPFLLPPMQLSVIDRFLGDLTRVAAWMGYLWVTHGYVVAKANKKVGHHTAWLVEKVDLRAWTALFLWCKSAFNFSGNEWENWRNTAAKDGKGLFRCSGTSLYRC
jgi:hypothetical protein